MSYVGMLRVGIWIWPHQLVDATDEEGQRQREIAGTRSGPPTSGSIQVVITEGGRNDHADGVHVY